MVKLTADADTMRDALERGLEVVAERAAVAGMPAGHPTSATVATYDEESVPAAG